MSELFYITGNPKNLRWFYDQPDHWPQPFCVVHEIAIVSGGYSSNIKCEDCTKPITLPSKLQDYCQYVHRKIKGKRIGKFKTVRIDIAGSAVLAKERVEANDTYFIESKLSDTEGGLQLMVLTGKKDGSGKKVQLFVEPGTKRMNFDRNESDQHPAGIFTQVSATFKDSDVTISSQLNNQPSDPRLT